MKDDKINALIAEENEQRQQKAARRARELISQILDHQNEIRSRTEAIEVARKELRTLDVTEVTAAEILG